MEEVKFDPRLQGPFTMIVAGPTSCGKSQLVLDLIKNADSLIHPRVKDITYCYSQWQPSFDRFQGRVSFNEGIIPMQEIIKSKKKTSDHSLVDR